MGERIASIAHIVIGAVFTVVVGLLLLALGYNVLMPTALVGGGLAIVAVIFVTLLTVPDSLQSQATESMLRTASATLRHLRSGLTPEGCQSVCLLLLPETRAEAIAMTDTQRVLAYVGEDFSTSLPGMPNSAPVMEVLSSGRPQTLTGRRGSEWSEVANLRREAAKMNSYVAQSAASIILPLIVSDRAIGTIKLYYRSGRDVDRTQMAIARGLAELLATQLSVSELARQAELTAQAEVRALQAQINPHFLFNTLNTMASLTRTDPERARELLREFSLFYRGTLENSQQQIQLAVELEQTRRYLRIEKARFGEDRIILNDMVEPGCERVPVPGFIVQPVVENAVRHAMREEGALHIDVSVFSDGGDLVIDIADDGLGMDDAAIAHMMQGSSQESSRASKGTGVAIRNVAERIELTYGSSSSVQVRSQLDVGTRVTLRLAGAAPRG